MDTAELTQTEIDMLDLERYWFRYAGLKEAEIRRRFDLSTTSYYARLNRLIDREAALAFDPLLVRRLRRIRDHRQRSRSARRHGLG